jgi:hypothetical protein
MPIPKPESRTKQFFKSSTPWDILSGIAGGGTGAASAYKFLSTNPLVDPNAKTWGTVAAIGVGLSVGSQITKAVLGYKAQKSKSSMHDLAGCLHTLNGILLADDKNAGLRATVHVPDGEDQLVQVLDYVGDNRKPKTEGRRRPINCGVIGKACREREAFCGHRTTDKYEDFLQQMVRVYSMTDAQARALDPATQAWMAAPLPGANNAIEGVLYLDSTDRAFFTEARQAAIVYGSVAIAFYVGLRYA